MWLLPVSCIMNPTSTIIAITAISPCELSLLLAICVSPQDPYIGRLLCGQHVLYFYVELVASISYIAWLVVLVK